MHAGRLSTPAVRKAPRALSARELGTLLLVADTLIPGNGVDPSATDAPAYTDKLVVAVDARAESFDRLVAVLGSLSAPDAVAMWAELEALSAHDPTGFHLLSSVVAGAYLLVPQVMSSIGYPGQGRSPAPVDLAVEQIGDGILDPVIARGPIFRSV